MITYEEAKELLSEKRSDISHFTEEFFNTYIEERHRAIMKMGEPFEATTQTDFYRLNGGAYCEFLEVINSSMPRFRFKFFNKGKLSWRTEGSFDGIEEAKVVGRQLQKVCGNDDMEVEQC